MDANKENKMYTNEMIAEFAEFSKRHGFQYNTVIEYRSALIQYFKE